MHAQSDRYVMYLLLLQGSLRVRCQIDMFSGELFQKKKPLCDLSASISLCWYRERRWVQLMCSICMHVRRQAHTSIPTLIITSYWFLTTIKLCKINSQPTQPLVLWCCEKWFLVWFLVEVNSSRTWSSAFVNFYCSTTSAHLLTVIDSSTGNTDERHTDERFTKSLSI